MSEQTTIFLTPMDAEQFKDFQKNYTNFCLLRSHGIFDVQYGKITLNIGQGQIQTIVKEEIVYKR